MPDADTNITDEHVLASKSAAEKDLWRRSRVIYGMAGVRPARAVSEGCERGL